MVYFVFGLVMGLGVGFILGGKAIVMWMEFHTKRAMEEGLIKVRMYRVDEDGNKVEVTDSDEEVH